MEYCETIDRIFNKNMKVKFKKLHEGAILPKKATEGSAAYDLYVPEDFIVEPGRTVIPLGFAIEMTPGYEALIDARSGFSCRGMEGHEVFTISESKAPNGAAITGFYNPTDALSTHLLDMDTKKCMELNPKGFDCDVIEGKIDSDFRKGVGVIVHSRDKRTFLIKAGTRIAQMTFHKVETVEWEETDELSQTDRDGGFGSTGTK